MMGAGLEGRLVVIERLTGFDDMGGILVAEGLRDFMRDARYGDVRLVYRSGDDVREGEGSI